MALKIDGEKLAAVIDRDITSTRKLGACESRFAIAQVRGMVVEIVITDEDDYLENNDDPVFSDDVLDAVQP